MAKFWILEDNADRMHKYALRYGRKAGHGVLRPTGEKQVREDVMCSDGIRRTLCYVEWEADETIIRRDGWTFAAVLEHHGDSGNVIRRCSGDDVPPIPERYRTARPYCDCCRTDRDRKDTYLVYNGQTGKWAQVGRSCLREYTGGLSPEAVAAWMSMWDEAVHCGTAGGGVPFREYRSTGEVLQIASEVVRLHGYAPTTCPEDVNPYDYMSTKQRVVEHWLYDTGRTPLPRYGAKDTKARLDADRERGYDADAVDLTDILSWVREQDTASEYMHNVQTLCASEWCEARDTGILCSVPHVYNKAMGRIRERKNREAVSHHIGSVGERLTIRVHDGKVLTSWETVYGTTYLYQWYTEDGSVVIWKTSKGLYEDKVTEITGTVKEHGSYHDVSQTELTRCKVKY